ncbi:uncharacterized protein BDZ99DRAFT_471372 [Mytilinidion resinicola]|uniref:histidine kinase n=1 Tax=Mytilinidion resinicola TaxID=574789 RepID=A0A6A6Z742_9PEZI|nr:uncharacterized protein BDZ99DRAFT_471372 [Mytilinidion resinicola]KAF2816097.1 hypothetical protein BDZ99DRAFT_471372 [Mytilinidion resinicola]
MRPEATRERDLYRYYQPWLDAQSLVEVLNQEREADTWGLTYKGYQPRSSRDKALTSWAQLATLRLNVRRGMVSLIDSSQQFILAEATKSLSLVSDNRFKLGDEVWLGNTIIARCDGVCHHTFASTYTALEEDGSTYTAEALVVPDLRLDDRFKNRDYVKGTPGVYFYAGVPIKTKAGHKIGVYAVSSDKPRFGLDADELRFMEDVAATVMEHLEMAKDRDDRNNGEKMVRGLAQFIEGMCSTEDLEEDLPPKPPLQRTSSLTSSPHTVSVMERQTENSRVDIIDQTEVTEIPTVPNNATDPLPRDAPTNAASTPQPTEHDAARVFSRAAQIIHDSTRADGVVFFSTTASNLIGHSPDTSTSGNPMDVTDESPSSVTDNEMQPLQRRRRDRANSRALLSSDSGTGDNDSIVQKKSFCPVVACSISDETAHKSKLSYKSFALTEESMQRYIRRFPYGKFFSFTEHGSGISSGDESHGEVMDRIRGDDKRVSSIKRSKHEPFVPTELLKVLPDVRSLIFLPLWDFSEGKYVAGAFIWTDQIGRLMNPDNELPYLKAFGNSIMSEIARQNAQKSDLAKTTFIASISHELRSPLHGILGSVEFLHDTVMDAYQTGLLSSIETCGKTLLDTIDHVLDYAKINKLRKANTRKKTGAIRSRRNSGVDSNNIIGLTVDFDLSVLVEEVVDAVCAGHAFKRAHPRNFHDPDVSQDASGPPSLVVTAATSVPTTSASPLPQEYAGDEVLVVLDVDPRPSWNVKTQPGALRRVVMNLLGNALKYTNKGHIIVSLKAEAETNPSTINVRLRFVDTGKGMSVEYQRTKLFSPFSQEDPFSVGTGLGLSIVRQIINSLGGSITVKSIQFVGTDIDVVLSLPIAESPVIQPEPAISSVAASTKGLALCLLHHDDEGEVPQSENARLVHASLEETSLHWFDMNVIRSPNANGVSADIFLYAEPPSLDTYLTRHGPIPKSTRGDNPKHAPIIVICPSATRALEFKSSLMAEGRVVEAIPQPCGPRKLARVLQKCLDDIHSISNGTYDGQASSIPRIASAPPKASQQVTNPPSTSINKDRLAMAPRRQSEHIDPLSSHQEGVITMSSLSTVTNANPVSNPPPGNKSLRPTPTRTPSARQPQDPVRVLLVDDNPINLQLLVMFMKKHKLPYASARNGLEALETYKSACEDPSKRFDFVLMDISMPVMDGLESTRHIRAFEEGREVAAPATIIALTGLASAQAQQEALRSGVNHYLPKPVKFQELRELLDT